MAKKSKKTDKKDTDKKATKRKAPPPIKKPDFGVDELAVELGVTSAIARQKLRAAGIKKDGRTYDFGNKKGVAEVASKLKTEKKPKKDKK